VVIRRKRGLQLPVKENGGERMLARGIATKARTLVDGDELGGGQRCGHTRAGHVGFVAVQRLVDLLNSDGRRDVVGVDTNAHLAWDALSGRMRRLRDTRLGGERLGRRRVVGSWVRLLLLLLHASLLILVDLRRRLSVTSAWALRVLLLLVMEVLRMTLTLNHARIAFGILLSGGRRCSLMVSAS
jgi:hypothetical protein